MFAILPSGRDLRMFLIMLLYHAFFVLTGEKDYLRQCAKIYSYLLHASAAMKSFIDFNFIPIIMWSLMYVGYSPYIYPSIFPWVHTVIQRLYCCIYFPNGLVHTSINFPVRAICVPSWFMIFMLSFIHVIYFCRVLIPDIFLHYLYYLGSTVSDWQSIFQ